MRIKMGLGAIILLFAVVVPLPQETLLSKESSHEGADFAERLFGPDGQSMSWQEREEALRKLNGRYSAVRKEALQVLRRFEPREGEGIRYGSQLHCALRTVRFWRMAEAQASLFGLLGLNLDPSSLPDGMDLPEVAFYPVAEALGDLPIRPAEILARFSPDNVRILAYVLVRSQGRGSAQILLAHYAEDKRFNSEALRQALDLIKAKSHDSDLLPPVKR
jgi:hypothetical protein